MFELLGNYNEKYLDNKAYTIIKFLYFNEVWSGKPYKIRKNNIKKIKKTAIMKYINKNKILKKKTLVKCIKYKNIILFKLFFRIFNKLNIEL